MPSRCFVICRQKVGIPFENLTAAWGRVRNSKVKHFGFKQMPEVSFSLIYCRCCCSCFFIDFALFPAGENTKCTSIITAYSWAQCWTWFNNCDVSVGQLKVFLYTHSPFNDIFVNLLFRRRRMQRFRACLWRQCQVYQYHWFIYLRLQNRFYRGRTQMLW